MIKSLQYIGPKSREVIARDGWVMRMSGSTYNDIAKHFEVSIPFVHVIIKEENERLNFLHEKNAEKIKDEHVMQLEFLISEARREYERSKLPIHQKKARRGSSQATGDAWAEEVGETTQVGNPKFLSTILDAMRQIRDIRGISAMSEVEEEISDLAKRAADVAHERRKSRANIVDSGYVL